MNNLDFAGLTEEEANRALCSWLNRKFPSRENLVLFALHQVSFQMGDDWTIGYEHEKLFTESHSAIHRVLDEMSKTERLAFMQELKCISPFNQVFTTPAQKTVAAIKALKLGRTNYEQKTSKM